MKTSELIIIWLLKLVHPSENNREPAHFSFPFSPRTGEVLPKHVLKMVIKIIKPCVCELYNGGRNTVLIIPFCLVFSSSSAFSMLL